MAIRVIAVEDHPLMLKAIRDELSKDPEILMVGELSHGSELAKMVYDRNPNVLILDLALSGEAFDPLTTVRNLKSYYPHLSILILTGYDDPLLMSSLVKAGALGYILKSDDLSMQLPKAVRVVNDGHPFYSNQVVEKLLTVAYPQNLTTQELAALRMVAKGYSNDEIAVAMGISEKRIRNILTIIYSKLNVNDDNAGNPRVASINKARELGLLDEK